MCTYKEACGKAKKMFAQNGYLDKVFSACDLPDKWLFFSKHEEDSTYEYGNCPISVDKKTGIPTWFNIFEAGTNHLKEYNAARPIPLPV